MEKTPEFKDKWMLAWFAAWVILFLPLGMGSVPETHGAYWREVMVLPIWLAFTFSVFGGADPAGGVAFDRRPLGHDPLAARTGFS